MADSTVLLRMKSEIEKAKTAKAQAEGSLTQLRKRLQEICGTDDLQEAEKMVDQKQAELDQLQKEIAAGIAQLEADYEWS